MIFSKMHNANAKQIPSKLLLINVLIVGEDHRFRFHPGFDVIAIVRAFIKNLFLNTHEGASTIEQQLVRTKSGRYEMTFKRKFWEIVAAFRLFLIRDREQIAWDYLNCAYYGTNYHSLEQIVTRFGYELTDEIPLEICAEIVARLKYPEPRKMTEKRRKQIARRKKHLLKLYSRYKDTSFLWKEKIEIY